MILAQNATPFAVIFVSFRFAPAVDRTRRRWLSLHRSLEIRSIRGSLATRFDQRKRIARARIVPSRTNERTNERTTTTTTTRAREVEM